MSLKRAPHRSLAFAALALLTLSGRTLPVLTLLDDELALVHYQHDAAKLPANPKPAQVGINSAGHASGEAIFGRGEGRRQEC